MLLDIKLEQTREMLCHEAAAAAVSVWLKRRYEMIFSQFWRFKLTDEDPQYPGHIGSRILIENWNNMEFLEQFHGIRTVNCQVTAQGDVINIIRRELETGLPVAMFFNYEYAYWLAQREKVGSYPILITGIDDASKGIYCIDIHILKKTVLIPMDDFLKGCGDCVIFSVVGDEKENIDWRGVIMDNIKYLQENNAFDSMRVLAELIRDTMDYTVETKDGKDVRMPEIVWKIQTLYRSRYLFSHAAGFLAKYHNAPFLFEVKESFEKLSNKWMTAWSMVLKGFLEKDFNSKRPKIAQKISEIACEEENLCNALLQAVEGHSTILPRTLSAGQVQKQPVPTSEFTFVDITKFLNNEGFASDMYRNRTADLTGMVQGEFMLTQGLPEDEIWNVGEMRFHFPHPVDGASDNISCNGQVLQLPRGNYSSVMFLGCGECGSQSEMVDIHFTDGNTVRQPLEFSDWALAKPIFNETVAWEGDCAARTIDGIEIIPIFKAHLFALAVPLDSGLQLESIGLPDCSSIHIFAVTLGK